jgi:cysteinyl-tRNA synthetase
MTKLVKIGVPAEQAQSMKRLRNVRAILDQRDAAVARIDATTADKIREALTSGGDVEAADATAATA